MTLRISAKKKDAEVPPMQESAGGGGNVGDPPHDHMVEQAQSSIEAHGHSDSVFHCKTTPIGNPRSAVLQLGNKHSRKISSTESDLTAKRAFTGDKRDSAPADFTQADMDTTGEKLATPEMTPPAYQSTEGGGADQFVAPQACFAEKNDMYADMEEHFRQEQNTWDQWAAVVDNKLGRLCERMQVAVQQICFCRLVMKLF